MTTQQIRFFLEAAGCLNFSEAARRLFVSQPTLSKQIAMLEEELGVKLFTRNNRVVSLTPVGGLLRDELGKAERTIFTAMEQARSMEQGTDGRLSIGILELSALDSSVTPLLQALQEKYPRLDLTISFMGFSEMRNALVGGTIDAAFSKDFDASILTGVSGVDIKKNMPAVLMPKHHPLAFESSLSIAQLRDENFVVLSASESRASGHSLIDLCGREGFFPKIVKYAESNMDRVYYVKLGYGVAVVDADMPLPQWADLTIVPICTDGQEDFAGIDLRLIWLEQCQNPSLRLLIDEARSMFPDRAPA